MGSRLHSVVPLVALHVSGNNCEKHLIFHVVGNERTPSCMVVLQGKGQTFHGVIWLVQLTCQAHETVHTGLVIIVMARQLKLLEA